MALESIRPRGIAEKAKKTLRIGTVAGLTIFLPVAAVETQNNLNGWLDKQGQIEDLPIGYLRYGIDNPIGNLNYAISSLDSPSTSRSYDKNGSKINDSSGGQLIKTSRYPDGNSARIELEKAARYYDNGTIQKEIFSVEAQIPDEENIRLFNGKFVDERTNPLSPVQADIAQIINETESLANSPEVVAANELKEAKYYNKVFTWLWGIGASADAFILFPLAGIRLKAYSKQRKERLQNTTDEDFKKINEFIVSSRSSNSSYDEPTNT